MTRISHSPSSRLEIPMASDVRTSQIGEPTWELAAQYPLQGSWAVEQYLALDVGRQVEFDNGKLEFLPWPTELQQAIALFLCFQVRQVVEKSRKGICLVAPFRVKINESRFREPDVLFMLEENRERRKSNYWNGADLVIEIVSEDDPNRDLIEKRFDYAQAGVQEYWIVDPRDRSILVLSLETELSEYRETARCTDGEVVRSQLIDRFEVLVTEVFDRPEVMQ